MPRQRADARDAAFRTVQPVKHGQAVWPLRITPRKIDVIADGCTHGDTVKDALGDPLRLRRDGHPGQTEVGRGFGITVALDAEEPQRQDQGSQQSDQFVFSLSLVCRPALAVGVAERNPR